MTRLHPETRDVLDAVREAVAIPYPATVGDAKVRTRILMTRVLHLAVFCDSVLDRDTPLDFAVEHLREGLAGTPATGYKTWHEAAAERKATEAAAGGDGA